jgi:acyl-coenzyme A synthetase/AMP-(fatty) acid ligase
MDQNWQNVTDPIFHWAAERPDAPAFIQLPETLSYGELATLVGKAAVYLDSIGIRQGDRVAINLTNSIDHFILTLGLLRLGATTMEIAYNAQRPPSAEFLAKFGVGTIFVEPVAAAVAGFRSIKLDIGWRGIVARYHGDRRSDDDGDGIFAINLTSGTTGEPKGSLTSHRRYFQRMRIYPEMFADSGVFSSDRPATFLLAASIGFSVYFRRMMNHLSIGGRVTILPEFLYTVDLVKAIGSWDDALCFISSAMCRVLLACAPQQGLLFPRLRALGAGGGFLYPQEKLAILERVTPNFYHTYGASGFGTVAVLPPREMRERPASVGRPPAFVEAQVVGEAGRPLPPGAFGRLRFRGTEGTFPADVDPASRERFHDGWFYPGDSGHLDEAGYVFLKGRDSDVIRRRGAAIFAAEIEAVIAQHPGVTEVAVVGVPRQAIGVFEEELVALVATRGEIRHEALAQHCQARLPSEHWPDRLFYAPALPKTAGGKLDRARVRAIVLDQIASRGGALPPSASA